MKGQMDVFDDVLPDPMGYRQSILTRPFVDVPIGPVTFHGIGFGCDGTLPSYLTSRYAGLTPHTSFCRQSPEGQAEPNFIHTDLDMGDWTAILYLTPDPPAGDGTTFWKHRKTGLVASPALTQDERIAEAEYWRQTKAWEPWATVEAKFNRLVVFPSGLFHSRALADNYGRGEDARLIQVVFGTGDFAARYEVPVCQ